MVTRQELLQVSLPHQGAAHGAAGPLTGGPLGCASGQPEAGHVASGALLKRPIIRQAEAMGASTARASFRVNFTDYVPDPNDADCIRRSMTIPADEITFEDEQVVFRLVCSEVARFALNMVVTIKVDSVPVSGRQGDPEELRAQYPNLGKPWTAEDESKLLTMYREGQRDFNVLAEEFGRQPGAIRSRLGKLGLDQL
ncbi:SANT/Myb-like DNA-binding domain-containing protein [Streptomyces lasiicapitis]|uniref:SANT/Myb-like DNA-binding domain-containing protein n=1 Tax=Streptomyces lasiicapitis TaxID=1923961 RepID=UPI00331A8192